MLSISVVIEVMSQAKISNVKVIRGKVKASSVTLWRRGNAANERGELTGKGGIWNHSLKTLITGARVIA